jgi:hypothetical protein
MSGRAGASGQAGARGLGWWTCLLVAVLPAGHVGCAAGAPVDEGLDPQTTALLTWVRESGTPLTGGTDLDGVGTRWKAWLSAGEPVLIEERVQIQERGTTTSLYLFEEGRLAFYRQTGQRPTSVPRGAGLEAIELELRWDAAGGLEGAKRIDGVEAELPEWEAAVARERARDLRALVMAQAGAQGAGGEAAAGSSAETSL